MQQTSKAQVLLRLLAIFAASLASPISQAEGVLFFGSSSNEVFFLLSLPLICSAVLALYMFFSLRTAGYLLGAGLLTVVWGLIAIGTLQSAVGALMLLFTPWALFAFLTIGFLICLS